MDIPNSFETFTLTIALGNAAMDTPEDVAGLLVDIAKYMHRNGSWYPETVRDINGNTVGSVRVL